MSLLIVQDLKKSFRSPSGNLDPVLYVPEFSLQQYEQVAIRGASGSGKTTFLHLLAGVLPADSGTVSVDGTSLHLLTESQRDQLRVGKIGYVFQSFNLLNGFTCLENITLAMNLNGSSDVDRAKSLLSDVGLWERKNHYPHQLSIGQQQRVAIARALVNQPKLVLADEPTGNLDPFNTDRSLILLRKLCQQWGSSLILVSHDDRVMEQFESQVEWEKLNEVATKGELLDGDN
tara:strand:- start:11184 stop:11879 length:696 start_codon:yes stop_codon:yes gene_type:complete